MAADRRHLPRPVSLIRRRPRRTAPPAEPEPAAAPSARSGLIDSAVYRDGRRQASTTTLGDTFRVLREHDVELLRLGTESVLYAILDAVVDGYLPVVAGLENDVDEIETQVFSGDPAVSRRIYELSREVIDFQRAASPLGGMLVALEAGF